ncbi:hypothetical protein NUW58_g3504 [Xylaria curta]|uniref:Uncharacterized protein n=1 Tax=Xylaria curta TaxID=42375 RepID=A0ACC1PAM6_9PEZI|nr:hypothetical protein NUW58_g3504 [Xylaria curta]
MSDPFSVGRFQAGFAQATQELTVAAINGNFDFALIKVEAPLEYRAIANALSPARVRDAESGPLHTTASRLGALFEHVFPPTPNLIKAYGVRASEISSQVAETEAAGSANRNWIRTDYGGIDASSIWAAATSSKAALPMHLLACMISRLWNHAEATSIWTELVAERKLEILTALEQGVTVQSDLIMASKQEITREQLAKWAASAKAWLQTADEARKLQHKQFLLIINNLSHAIHQEKTSLYSNVIRTWTSALTAMEGLVSGKSLVVEDGSVLLGLPAWHLYPDMIIDGSLERGKTVSMKDPLIAPGGVLILGISESGSKEGRGVYWSLSLAHHRFYGEAIRKTRRLDVDGSRLSLNELFLACMGGLLRSWSVPSAGSCTRGAFQLLLSIADTFPSDRGENSEGNNQGPNSQSGEYNWRHNWRDVMRDIHDSYISDEKQASLAISLGRRRPRFLPSGLTMQKKPLFQLTQLSTLLFLLSDQNHKIELLRRLCSRMQGLDKDNSVIFCVDTTATLSHRIFASAFKTEVSHDGDSDETETHPKRGPRHRRWVDAPKLDPSDYTDDFRLYHRVHENISLDPTALGPSGGETNIASEKTTYDENIANLSSSSIYMTDGDLLAWGAIPDIKDEQLDRFIAKTRKQDWDLASENELDNLSHGKQSRSRPIPANVELLKPIAKALDELQRQFPNESVEILTDDKYPWSHDPFLETVTWTKSASEPYDFFFGATGDFELLSNIGEDAGVFVRNLKKRKRREEVTFEVTLEDLLWCFQSNFIDPGRLKMTLETQPAFGFFKVLAGIQMIFKEPAADGATISGTIVDSKFTPPIFSKTMNPEDWAEPYEYLEISQRTAIALIGYLETGYDVIAGMQGDHRIMGLSGGDSIYVLTALLTDPTERCPDYSFTRILGNTGTGGFSILACPSNLMARSLNKSAWRIESTSFDGKPVDSFTRTSLHLRFTDWQAPLVSFDGIGQRDADAKILESVISVQDSGNWVADVDIYRALTDKMTSYGQYCSCETPDSLNSTTNLSSVDTWDQVLDCADGPVVF